MKSNYLMLFTIGIALSFTACKKSNLSENGSPLKGKWLQTKIRLYADSAGKTMYDTTYTQPFTTADYIQFNADGTCAVSSDHYYYPNISNFPRTAQSIPVSVANWKFGAINNTEYVLKPQTQLVNPGGFDVGDTVIVVSEHLIMLHAVSNSHVPGYDGTADSYYER